MRAAPQKGGVRRQASHGASFRVWQPSRPPWPRLRVRIHVQSDVQTCFPLLSACTRRSLEA